MERPSQTSRWATSSVSDSQTPSAAPASVDNASPDQLTGMIRSVHLDSTPSRPHRGEESWRPTERILSDLSQTDFDIQAQANSLAASQAMSHIPRSILNPPQTPMNLPPPPPLRTSASPEQYPLYQPNTNRSLLIGEARTPFSQAAPTITTTATAKPDFVSAWYSQPVDSTLNDPKPDAWRFQDHIPRDWHQPRFRAGHRFEELAARDRLQPAALGGKSKKDQLGSVNSSWGPLGEEGPKVYGMFEIERDPPSRSTSPFKDGKVAAAAALLEEEAAEKEARRPEWSEVKSAKYEAIGRARQGTTWDRRVGTSEEVKPQLIDDTPKPIETPQALRDRDQRSVVDSAFGSRNGRGTSEYNDLSAQTPMSSISRASRDVFGPKEPVSQIDDGW